MEDWLLLRKYLEQGSEAAFRELMSRQLDLVYSTALRRLGNAHAAEDVTQAVFCLLARKAPRLRPKGSLMGWLYQTAYFMAAKHQSREFRRQRREQEAVQTLADDNTQATPWEHLAPVLDEVMLGLSEPERELLLLRFFKGTPLLEVGRSIGISEDAARMRINRSLEKLRDLLQQRGITSTTAALAAVLGNKGVEATPVSTALTIQNEVIKSLTAASITSNINPLLALMKQTPLLTIFVIGSALILAFVTTLHFYNHFAAPREQTDTTPPRTFSHAQINTPAESKYSPPRIAMRKGNGSFVDKNADEKSEIIPQVYIAAKFLEMPAATTNSNSFLKSDVYELKVLSNEQATNLMSEFETKSGVDVLTFPNVTTLSGRQAQISSTVERPVLFTRTNQESITRPFDRPLLTEKPYQPADNNDGVQTNMMVRGPSLNVTPEVLSDNIIQLTLSPEVIEFMGYDPTLRSPTSPLPLPVGQFQSDGSVTIVMPAIESPGPSSHLRTRQSSDRISIESKQWVLCGPFYFEKHLWESANQKTDQVAISDDTKPAAEPNEPMESRQAPQHIKVKTALYVLTTAKIVHDTGNEVINESESSSPATPKANKTEPAIQ